MFAQQLAFAVGVGGRKPRIFDDGRALGLAIAGSSRAEDEALVAGRVHRVEQAEGAAGVIAKVGFGAAHGLAGLDQSGKMHDAVEASFGEGLLEQRAILQASFNQVNAFGNGRGSAMTEVVEDGNRVPLCQQQAADRAADVACSARNENVQCCAPEALCWAFVAVIR